MSQYLETFEHWQRSHDWFHTLLTPDTQIQRADLEMY